MLIVSNIIPRNGEQIPCGRLVTSLRLRAKDLILGPLWVYGHGNATPQTILFLDISCLAVCLLDLSMYKPGIGVLAYAAMWLMGIRVCL